MTFKVVVIPLGPEPLQVTVEAQSESSPTFLYVGSWKGIRDFLIRHLTSGGEFSIIENDLRRDRLQRFTIEASEASLSSAEFNPVKRIA
jgi:hypothetical protein